MVLHKATPENALFSLWLCATLLFMPCVASAYTTDQIRSAVWQAGGPTKFISEIANNTAKMAPRMFDKETELIGATATGTTIVYYLRIVNYDKADIPNVSSIRQDLSTRNMPSVCTAPVASILINEYGAEYKYIYYSKRREYLFEFTLNKSACAGSATN